MVMDAELISLEEKVQQLVALCRGLRDENRNLRQDLLQAQQDNQHLANKLAGSKERVATILAKLPEDMA
jgi:cell division protein ZapB